MKSSQPVEFLNLHSKCAGYSLCQPVSQNGFAEIKMCGESLLKSAQSHTAFPYHTMDAHFKLAAYCFLIVLTLARKHEVLSNMASNESNFSFSSSVRRSAWRLLCFCWGGDTLLPPLTSFWFSSTIMRDEVVLFFLMLLIC